MREISTAEARTAKRAWAAAMSRVQLEMREAEPADVIDNILRLAPIYTRHGFKVQFSREVKAPGAVRLICSVSHGEGFERRDHLDVETGDVPELVGSLVLFLDMFNISTARKAA